MLYSRVRNERNQLNNSSSGGGGGGTGGSTTAGSSANIGTANNDGSGRSGGVVAGTPGGSNNSGPTSGGSSNTDRDSFSRWRDRQYYGPRRWFQNSRDDSQWDKDNGKKINSLKIMKVYFIIFFNCFCCLFFRYEKEGCYIWFTTVDF